MSYLVLARKWRPQSFETLVGQEHVVRALSHALSSQRLHHAWLFTGTRGVGKTTLARILAKSLNCEQGITATPCGKCQACIEIDSGRFVDYIELDAASNRGIDEMTQLLEQAIYAPSVGRFKVYVIDEVHMLTGPAFNAMLKTLEEPPAHVKFVLATTDPQKIPATILSRCLQFNLKQMAPDSIISHLGYVLEQEGLSFDVKALRLIARAAAGSMRDALSLTDQAIAFSAGDLTLENIHSMLGTVDQSYLVNLLQAIVTKNAKNIIEIADELSEKGLSLSQALADMSVLLSNISIEQNIANTISDTDPLCEQIKTLAHSINPNTVHLLYTVAVHSRNELSLSPDEYAGFVMACLRMLSLAPETNLKIKTKPQPEIKPASEAKPKSKPETEFESESEFEVKPKSETNSEPEPEINPESYVKSEPKVTPTAESKPEAVNTPQLQDTPQAQVNPKSDPERTETESTKTENTVTVDDATSVDKIKNKISITDINSQTWPQLVKTLPLSGAVEELARQSEWIAYSNQQVSLRMGVQILGETSATEKLQSILTEYFGFKIKLTLQYAATGKDTVFALDQAHKQKQLDQAKQDVQDDPFVQTLVNQFQGQVIEKSIKPVNQN